MNKNIISRQMSFTRLTRLEQVCHWRNVEFTVAQTIIDGQRGWVANDNEQYSGLTREEAATKFVVASGLFAC